MDYKKNQKYFKPMNFIPTIVLCLLGLIFCAVGGSGIVIGILAIAAGAAWLYFQIKGRPTDADIDAVVASQLADLKTRALRKLGVDEDEVSEIAPISFDGYVYPKALIKRGKDGVYRSSKYQAVMFLRYHPRKNRRLYRRMNNPNLRPRSKPPFIFSAVLL